MFTCYEIKKEEFFCDSTSQVFHKTWIRGEAVFVWIVDECFLDACYKMTTGKTCYRIV